MAGKRFKGKTCVYCGSNPSLTGDHVFPRSLFTHARRDNLPQVPACEACNNAKSALETYLSAALAIGGRHRDARAMVDALPRKLAHNHKLQQEIEHGMQRAIILEPPPRPGMIPLKVPFRGADLHALLAYAARGLFFHHWHVPLPSDCIAHPVSLTRRGDAHLQTLLSKYGARTACADLGEGTICYEGRQMGDAPEFSFWRFVLYGGVRFFATNAPPQYQIVSQAVITGRPHVLEHPEFSLLLS